MRRGFLYAVVAVCLSACGGGKDSFSPSTYTGTLSGGASGTFSYTVEDSIGNASGTAKVASKTFTLRGYSHSNGDVWLQFQGQADYDGAITATRSGGSVAGTWELWSSSLPDYKGTASATQTSSGGGCSSVQGSWTSDDGYHHWQINANGTATITTDSYNVPGAQQITDVNYSDSGSALTYTITRAAMTGSGGSDYSYNQSQLIAQGLNIGPFTEKYTLINCVFSIGGKNYHR